MSKIESEISELEKKCFGIDIDGEIIKEVDSKGNEFESGCVQRFINEENVYNAKKTTTINVRTKFLERKLKNFQEFLTEFSRFNYDYFALSKRNGLEPSEKLLLKIGIDRTALYINYIQNIYIIQISQELNQLNVDKSFRNARFALISSVVLVIVSMISGVGASWFVSKHFYKISKPDSIKIEKLYKGIISSDSTKNVNIQERLDLIQTENIESHNQLILLGQELKSRETLNLQLIQAKDIRLKFEALENTILKLIEKEEGLHSLTDSVLIREDESTN